ncbi:MAG: N-acyl homoserine lactone hydrolase [Myxococcota bacterium]|jgi:N-acyl homoserine lactone hydrolase
MLLLALACTLPRVDRESFAVPMPLPYVPQDPVALLTHQAFISGYAPVKVDGLINLDNPGAAGLDNEAVRVAIVVHALTHPTHGTVYIDTGIPETLAVRGVGRLASRIIESVLPMSDIIAQTGPPAAVFLTHTHADHILGLPDIPVGTPIYVGSGEWEPTGQGRGLLRRSIKATFGEHTFTELAFTGPLGTMEGSFDVWGDGSLVVMPTPGHTPGSISMLARTTQGGMLFVGDNSHTLWGWEHGVEPGGFTLDHEQNARNLVFLKDLAETVGLQVWVGHETDGVGTGISDEPAR